MPLRAPFRTFLDSLFRRARVEAEMEEELRAHIASRAADLERSGLSRPEAQRRARIEFGGYQGYKEQTREALGTHFVEALVQDARFGLRMLRKNPGFTAIAVLTLALGIGANTAMFSVINSVLLQPLPFHDPDRLMRVYTARQTPVNLPVSGEDYFDWQAQNRSFEATCIYTAPQDFNASGAGEPETISVVSTQANYFSLLGVAALEGRTFQAGEDQPGKNLVAVLSYGFWQRHFAGAAQAIGKSVKLNFETYQIVGVMPPAFRYPEGVEIWIPLQMSVEHLGRRGGFSYRVLGRLKPGLTQQQAQADMTAVARGLAQQFPVTNANVSARVVPFKEIITGDSRPQLLVLLAAVALVLLVACANVANLLLARATTRQREIALRATLGASRGRLLRQLLTESLMLSAAGAAAGLAGAWWLVKLAQSAHSLPIPRQNPVQLDGTVLLFTAGISVAVGILFGLAPALEASRSNLIEEMKSSAGPIAGVTGKRLALRNALVAGEVATCLALLIGAGLLLRSFARMRSADLGVRTENIMTAALVLPETRYKTAADRRAFYARLLERLEQIPGVAAAATSQQIPLEGSHGETAKLQGDTDPRHEGLSININFVSPGYFRVFGIPFLAGRNFSPEEIERAAASGEGFSKYWKSGAPFGTTPLAQFSTYAIINHTMARALWPGQDPTGKLFYSDQVQPTTVVGEVGDEKYSGIREAPLAEAYFPIFQQVDNAWYPVEICVRSSGAPESALAGIRDAVRGLDGELSLFRVRSMQQVIADGMQDTTLQTVLLGAFAGLALVLSAVGIYGVMAYLVTQRTHEIGLRMALGAQRRNVFGLVIGRGAGLALAGIAAGLVAALGLTRLMSSLLYEVSASDPATLAASAVLLLCVALGACYLPARRATRVDPMVALRWE